ncbi:YkoF-like protein [Thelephora ganbajun]|uniref:YkoF-like protein n=1 Tax=Thelephora ganbajun TaxID=370292 RepID=A0ACB6ZNZ2_THEGA|nr:YkoF-like protein [Thelephora ganbajun]
MLLMLVVDFCLVQIGTGPDPSVAEYIAECQRVLEKSGLKYKLFNCHSEGPWHEVTKAIHDCHAAVHAKGAPRIATDVRIGTRVDQKITPGEGNNHKVARVLEILARDTAS